MRSPKVLTKSLWIALIVLNVIVLIVLLMYSGYTALSLMADEYDKKVIEVIFGDPVDDNSKEGR